jgi:hypothetical protein
MDQFCRRWQAGRGLVPGLPAAPELARRDGGPAVKRSG